MRAERESCSACHVRLRPQVYQEIRQAAKIHMCGSCRRYLFHESLLTAPPASTSAPLSAPGTEVEAVNGGAV